MLIPISFGGFFLTKLYAVLISRYCHLLSPACIACFYHWFCLESLKVTILWVPPKLKRYYWLKFINSWKCLSYKPLLKISFCLQDFCESHLCDYVKWRHHTKSWRHQTESEWPGFQRKTKICFSASVATVISGTTLILYAKNIGGWRTILKL